jgi:UDP-N-acetylmuramoyl-L-alanyl-D-glutamate--2,6-diaminopimelate ligase
VFTNLTRDHLDFHGDMDHYFAAKRVLFDTLLRPGGHAVVNVDDDHGRLLAGSLPGRRVWTFALDAPADVRAERIALSLQGTALRVATPMGALEVRTPLVGRFNASNVLAALGAALALGLPSEAIVAGIGSVALVPGRLERIEAGQDFAVIVDYAHTDDALKNLLETVRELGPKRIVTVFGCGGDRDRAKRPLMGAVAARLSDVVVVTSDNPRSEPPESILEEIQRGMNGGRGAERRVVVDRRDAIAQAIGMAGPGDAVVIAGKGHETYQVLRDRTVPFDDRLVARELLADRTVRGRRG